MLDRDLEIGGLSALSTESCIFNYSKLSDSLSLSLSCDWWVVSLNPCVVKIASGMHRIMIKVNFRALTQ